MYEMSHIIIVYLSDSPPVYMVASVLNTLMCLHTYCYGAICVFTSVDALIVTGLYVCLLVLVLHTYCYGAVCVFTSVDTLIVTGLYVCLLVLVLHTYCYGAVCVFVTELYVCFSHFSVT